VVIEDGLEDLVDLGLRVRTAGLEGLRDLVKQQAAADSFGRKRGDPAVADEGPQLLRGVGEEAGGTSTHRRPVWRERGGSGQRDMVRGTVSRVTRYDDDLRFAHVLADNADDITTRRFRALDLRVDTKPDLTPVSDADHAAEDSLRNVLRRSRPRDAVLGEETGRTGSGSRCWVIDPIDGTKNYVRGVPVWATLIGLMDGPDVVVGVVSAPALSRRWWAALGGGAWTGRSLTKASPLRVSSVTKLGDASMSYSGLGGWSERGLMDNFLGLTRSVWRTRAFGDFWSHMLVAEGACDISAEPEVNLWDLAALQIIVTEAGGRFTSLEGEATPGGGSVVCTNGHLHDEVLARLRDSQP
jgi:histidinol-phosphatase